MQGGAVGEVTKSNDPSLKAGDLVQSFFGWREAFNAPAGALQKLDTHGLPPQAFLGYAGMPGLTAYVGLLRIAEMKDGDVVFVSGAAGAVGSVACQIAKLKGHTVIGSAGGAEKVAFLKEIGVDHAIDYKAEPDLTAALMRAAPDGIDVYFENVGGAHMEAALMAAKPFGRFALCGMISQYNNTDLGEGVRGLVMAVGKSLKPARLHRLQPRGHAGRLCSGPLRLGRGRQDQEPRDRQGGHRERARRPSSACSRARTSARCW